MGIKIYELAKEIDIPSLDLVEQLRAQGFAVRNHMSSLAEDEVASFKEYLAKEAESKAEKTKKKTKKKTTKKKAAKKKVAKKKVSPNKIETVKDEKILAEEVKDLKEADDLKKAKKTTVVRKKIVKKKAAVAVEPAEEFQEPAMKGLEVIAPAPEEKTETSIEQNAAPTVSSEQGNTQAKPTSDEKMHSFTPVFIPEKKEQGSSTPTYKKINDGPKHSGTPDAKAGDKENPTGKKRFGDLAAMVSKGKSSVNKSRDLTELRANEQMKAYSVGGAVGNTYFQNIGKKKVFNGAKKQTMITEVKDSKRVVYFNKFCTVAQLADALKEKFNDLRDKALDINLLLKEDDYLGIHLANEIAALYRYRVEDKAFDEKEVLGKKPVEEDPNAKPRNPIITVMGHVDHGKTTLVDHIRKSKVTEGEAGGITQHIGAYSVEVNGGILTFLDTPGHAAFGAMRSRGAQVTDLVILVVAADDGVMPQTKESIRFCKEAGVPIIVAVNKMDKEGANPENIKQQLTEFELVPEEWGGTTMYCPISALKGDGIDDLLENVHLQAEILELKANPKGKAEGVVIESKVEQGRGAVATILVQSGTLSKGDYIVVGESYGRTRSLMDYSGKQLKDAGPSTPVQVLGLNQAPAPGDTLFKVKNEREAKKVIENRLREKEELEKATGARKLEDFGKGDDSPKILKLIVRTDVQGSYEAIKNALEALGNDEVGVQIIGGGVGAISDSDVTMADSADGFIVGFNMRPVTSARRLSEKLGVDVKTYSIIYELINDVTMALEGMLEPERIEVYIGRAEVKDTFSIPKIGNIAGSEVIDGKIKDNCNIRLLREGKIMFDGKLATLKRFKDTVKEVANGLECGIQLENYQDVRQNDIFEAYMLEEKKRKLEETQI